MPSFFVILKRIFFFFILFLFPGIIHSSAQIQWTLQQCIDRAFEKNISVNQSKQNNEINRLTLDQSKANRLPDLNLTDGQNFSYGRSIDPFSNQYVDQNATSNNVSLNSTITLYNGRQNENTIRRNQFSYDAGKSDIETEKNTVSLGIVAAYLQVLLAYDLVEISKGQVTASMAQVEFTKKYVNAGKFPESNLLQIQSQLATDNYSLVLAENQLQNSKVVLMQLIELPVTDSFEIEKPEIKEMPAPSVHSTEEIYTMASGTLPQIKSASLKTESASYAEQIARGSQFPKLTLGGSLRTGYSSARDYITYQTLLSQQSIGYLQNTPSEVVIGEVPSTVIQKSNYPFSNQFKDNFSQLVNLSLTVPICNNKQAKTNIGKAKVASRIAELNEQNIKNQLRKNIEQAVTDEKGSEKKYIAANEQLLSEEATYSNLEKKFKLGMINSTEFLLEKNNYAKAKSNAAQSRYEYLFRIKVVDFYLGKSLAF